jgi:tetratricopeptide (TPR) repeat protein
MTSADRSGDNPPVTPLQPPAGSVPAENTQGKSLRNAVMAFALLLATGLGVVLLLPKWVSEAPPHAVNDVPDDSHADVAVVRQQAEQALQQFLRLQAEMKIINATVWGATEWNEAETRVRAGDRLFGERRFSEARQAYTSGIELLETLKSERPERLDSMLQAGWQALSENKADSAIEHFQSALAIEPDHVDALRGQAQAQVRDQVLQLMAVASKAQESAQFDAARDSYQSVLSLDPSYEPASTGLIRVTRMLKEQRFHAAMDRALIALDAARFQEADSALAQAAQLDPQHEALVDARQRLQVKRRQAAVNQLRRQASVQVRGENWETAVNLYNKVLRLDAGTGFARQGLVRAEQRATLNAQFDHYLENPERLYSAEPLANAEQLLDKNQEAPGNEPKLAGKIERLRILVAKARQPLPVELRSDGETEVTVYHVGRLGRFMAHRLELRPGTYTAVGVRSGYRDVRRVFSLKPGSDLATIDIRCEERI